MSKVNSQQNSESQLNTDISGEFDIDSIINSQTNDDTTSYVAAMMLNGVNGVNDVGGINGISQFTRK